MWSWSGAILKDLQEFAHVVSGDTSQLVNSAVGAVLPLTAAQGHPGESQADDCLDEEARRAEAMAAHVVAGDEDLPEQQLSKLPKRRILLLQTSEDVFLQPLEAAEEYRFAQWAAGRRADDTTWHAAVLADSAELRTMYTTLVEDEQRVQRGEFFRRYLARLRQMRVAHATRSVLQQPVDGRPAADGLLGWDNEEHGGGNAHAPAAVPADATGATGGAGASSTSVIDEVILLRKCNADLRGENARLRGQVAALQAALQQQKTAVSSSSAAVELAVVPALEVAAVAGESAPPVPAAAAKTAPSVDDDDDDWTNLS